MTAYAAERVREGLRAALRAALERCVQRGLPPEVLDAPITLEVPREREHGDYATNLAMTLARVAKMPPRQLAEAIVEQLERPSFVREVQIAGPGFLNFYLNRAWLVDVVADVLKSGDRYGDLTLGAGKRVLVEFVSANPTGPLNVVNARHAALGDALANVLQTAGYHVDREFYVNDAGNQVRMLGLAMETRLRQHLGEDVDLPEGAYPGEYLIPLAERFAAEHGSEVLQAPADERIATLARYAVEKLVADQRATLERYRTRYDRWFHETEVRASGEADAVIEQLKQNGHTYEADGALWLRSTTFGDDKDRVLIKNDGEYTYLVPDLAYHRNKLERGYDRLVNLLGQDHHGYHVRMGAALAALGYDPAALHVIYLQMVHLVRGGETVRVSKRQGEFVSMNDFLDEVSVDAARYFFLMRSPDTTMEFDLDLANLQTQENPVYYIQYAHARMAGILRQAAARGVALPDGEAALSALDWSQLQDESEFELLRKIGELPDEIATAAQAYEPHRLTHYAQALATAFHQFYTRCRVLDAPEPQALVRLALVRATQVTLRKTLSILGVSAPDRM